MRRPGLASELRVALDLISRGFDVFTPIAGYPATCDLIAVRHGVCLRIEVKTAHWELHPLTGEERLVGGLPSPSQIGRHDVLARATDTSVHYTPDLSPPDSETPRAGPEMARQATIPLSPVSYHVSAIPEAHRGA